MGRSVKKRTKWFSHTMCCLNMGFITLFIRRSFAFKLAIMIFLQLMTVLSLICDSWNWQEAKAGIVVPGHSNIDLPFK